jgi:hypothetical protein
MAELDAKIVNDSRVELRTSGVLELSLSPPESKVRSDQPREVVVNGQALSFGARTPLIFHESAGAWHAGPAAAGPRAKRAHLEGPLADVFEEPLVCVYGSLSSSTLRPNRELCQAIVRLRNGVDVRFPVLADRELTPEIERSHSLFVVGNGFDNALLAAFDSKLPIGVSEDGLRIGAEHLRSSEIGALFVYPNPRFPDRYVAVLTSPTIPGLFRALSLPQLLPDFVVYDSRLAPAAGQQVLGAAEVLAAGYFTNDWSLPAVAAPAAASAPARPASAAASAPARPASAATSAPARPASAATSAALVRPAPGAT